MSLSVDVYVPVGEGGIEVLDVPPGCSDTAGPEAWRTEVWGSEPVRSLGARFLPRLADEHLTVAPDEVSDLLAECALVRAGLAPIADHMRSTPGTGPLRTRAEHAEDVSRGLDNIEDAAGRALAIGGGVIIW
ncbi:hypothetical protein [Streptomyces fructofermentans]|uniref:Uncharacterized protein n=1 Tax=Streptomyces fructofermentans TaxID=152141 RepID=A0A918K673_9ACTN|nr:hypothetical protein [Streptomyces fructofermentans]GGX47557.1 hypothetical protein GCM10010515_13280 [Streptomyces fructofermentans]